MTKNAIVVLPETKRGRGRPFSGGRDLLFSFRMPERLREAVSRYAEDAEMSRSAAARELLECALQEAEYLKPRDVYRRIVPRET